MVFHVMINCRIDKKTKSTSYSMEKHGNEQAWKLAVYKFLQFRSIDPNSDDARLVMGAMKATMERF